jgi:glutaredoxin
MGESEKQSFGTIARPSRFPASIAMEHDVAEERTATLYRMVLPDHTCPFGVRAKELLEGSGFEVEDRVLSSRDEVDSFKAEQGVQTTPQVFIGGERIGGSDDLEDYLSNR